MQELVKEGRRGMQETEATLQRTEKLVEDTLQIGQQVGLNALNPIWLDSVCAALMDGFWVLAWLGAQRTQQAAWQERAWTGQAVTKGYVGAGV